LLHWSLAALILASVLLGSGISYLAALAGMVILGAASSISVTTAMTMLSQMASRETRGRFMAVFQMGQLGGGALGPVLAGLMATVLGWRALFWSGVLFSLVGYGALLLLRDVSFTVKKHVAVPRSPPGLAAYSRPGIAILFLVPPAVFLGIAGIQDTIIPIYADQQMASGAGLIGLALGIAGLFRFAGAFLAGMASDRFGRKITLVPGLIIQGLGVLSFLFVQEYWHLLISIALMSITSYGISVAATILGDEAPGHKLGRGIGVYRFSGDAGILFGSLLLSWLYSIGGSAAPIWVAGGSLITLGLLIAFITRESRWETGQPAE
jgi:MFS family permease